MFINVRGSIQFIFDKYLGSFIVHKLECRMAYPDISFHYSEGHTMPQKMRAMSYSQTTDDVAISFEDNSLAIYNSEFVFLWCTHSPLGIDGLPYAGFSPHALWVASNGLLIVESRKYDQKLRKTLLSPPTSTTNGPDALHETQPKTAIPANAILDPAQTMLGVAANNSSMQIHQQTAKSLPFVDAELGFQSSDLLLLRANNGELLSKLCTHNRPVRFMALTEDNMFYTFDENFDVVRSRWKFHCNNR